MGKSEGSSEDWLVTYSDMVTLLLTFFVLLYTLSPGVDQETFDSFVSYFQASSGIMDNSTMNQKPSKDSETYDEALQQWNQFEDYLNQNGLTSEVSIQRMEAGVKVTLSDSLTFNSGSAELLPLARKVLGKMAAIFDKSIEGVEVQGHTDNVPIAETARYPTNWHLGAARAVSVVLFVQKKSGLKPGKFVASSFGEYNPVAKNDSPAGRRRNRRVEIYIRYADSRKSLDRALGQEWQVSTGQWIQSSK